MAQDYGIRHATLTLTGAAQRLISAFPDVTPGGADDLSAIVLVLQPDGANAAAVFIGGEGVTTTDYGFRLAAAAAGVPPAPFVGEFAGARTKLSRWYAIGANGEKLHIMLVAF